MATVVYCSGLWGSEELGAGDGELGAEAKPEITLAIDDSICVFKF